MDGFPVKELLRPHRLRRRKDGLQDIRIFLCGNADRILDLAGEILFHPGHGFLHLSFTAVAAQGNEVRFHAPHIIGLLGKALPHGVRKQFDRLVSRLVAHGAVDHRQAVDVTDRHRRGARKCVGVAAREQLEALPILEACQQVGFQRRVREDNR